MDDLTDFEFDLTRRSHNILVAQIHHKGSAEEKALLGKLLDGAEPAPGTVESDFHASAKAVLHLAEQLASRSLATLEELGFWFPARLAPVVVQGIVADHGSARMEALSRG